MHAIRPWLWIGNRVESANPGLLYSKGITALLLLAYPVEHPGIISKYLPIEDAEILTPKILREAITFVMEKKGAGETVLIACSGGISRSVAIAVAALREAEGIPLTKALDDIKWVHPEAAPHPLLWRSLCDYFEGDH